MDQAERFPVRPVAASFAPYSPGRSIQEIRQAYQLKQVIKLASNENPLGASPRVQRRISRAAPQVFRYPQSGNPQLVDAISKHLGVDPSWVVPGNGSDELIDLIFRVLGRPGEHNTVLLEPSFSIYRMQARLHGLETRYVCLNEDFSFPWDALLDSVDQSTALVFVTNPDNPSGYTAQAEEILELARSLPEHALLVLDEAYIDFAEDPELYSPLHRLQETNNIVLLRTFSKMYGLAGLRLGYGILPPWLADFVKRIKLPFSVNVLAEQAGIEALRDEDFRELTRNTVLKQRRFLTHALTERDFLVYPSQANFLLLKPPVPAAALYEDLLKQGIIIRPLQSYGLPDHLRISIGSEYENQCLLSALDRILPGLSQASGK